MALDLSGLTAYIEENREDLMSKAILGSTFLNHVTIIDGVKSSVKVANLESTVPFQAGAGCNAVTSSGTTSLTQVSLATSPVEFTEKICLQTFEDYFTQKYLPKGAKPDSVAIWQDIVNRKIARVALQVEQMAFQGKTTYTNSTVLKQINGFVYNIDNAADEVITSGGGAGTALTTSTIKGVIHQMIYQDCPNAVVGKSPVLLMGMENFRIYLQKLAEDNAFNYFPSPGDIQANRVLIPGTNIYAYGIAGLNNDTPVDTGALPTVVKNRMIFTYKENLLFGIDSASDFSSLDTWYEKKDRAVYIYGRFRAGTAVRFTDHVVTY
jgi:hypothetical protein